MTQDPATTAPAPRAVRNIAGSYPTDQKGRLAVDGSLLDQVDYTDKGRGYAWATAWREACGCFKPEARRFVPNGRLGCYDHGSRLAIPPDDPFPISGEERRAAEERVWPSVAEKNNVPARCRLFRLDDLTPTPAVVAIRDFVLNESNEDRCIVLAGPCGVGKTVALVAGFRECAVWRCDPALAVFSTMAALARVLLSDDRDEVLDRCLEADVLAIDDVGGTYVKEGGLVETLFENILCEREGNELQTMLTTNLTLPAFTQAMGDRVSDRLRGPWGHWCSLPGQSLRRKRASGGRP